MLRSALQASKCIRTIDHLGVAGRYLTPVDSIMMELMRVVLFTPNGYVKDAMNTVWNVYFQKLNC